MSRQPPADSSTLGKTYALAQGWCALTALHPRIAGRIERALQSAHGLGVTEYSVLRVLSRQQGYHMRMQQLANAVVLSQSATTRVVNKLEDQGRTRPAGTRRRGRRTGRRHRRPGAVAP